LPDEIGLFEAMYSQRAIRSFKPDDIPEEAILRIVEAATKAPSGGNMQPWAFIVVRDTAMRGSLAEIARDAFNAMYKGALARAQPGDPPPFPRLKPMIEKIELIPTWIIVCTVLPEGMRPENAPMLAGSVYPAVQNLLLAARGLGIGSVLTGLFGGPQLARTAKILGTPPHVVPTAFIPLGYPDREHFGSTSRRPLVEVLHWDRWQGDRENTAAAVHR
jgi:nitroreductase